VSRPGSFNGPQKCLQESPALRPPLTESPVVAEQTQTEYCMQQPAPCDHPLAKVKINAVYVVANTLSSGSNYRNYVSGSRICSMPLWESNC
jgi:hypothetical protein